MAGTGLSGWGGSGGLMKAGDGTRSVGRAGGFRVQWRSGGVESGPASSENGPVG